MAPPHALRKSTHTTASQTTTRQGAQQSRMQVIEEVDECDDEVETEESQGTTDVALEQLMTKMVDNERKRYASQKKGVGKAYNANRATVEKAINTVFDEHEEYASLAHKAQLKRLQDLLDQKASIEATMMRQLASLQVMYEAHSRDLESVIDRRIKAMR